MAFLISASVNGGLEVGARLMGSVFDFLMC